MSVQSSPTSAQDYPCRFHPNLFNPNNSERFFEEGREQFEEEIERLEKKQPLVDDSLLRIDENLLRPQPVLELEVPPETHEEVPSDSSL